MFPKEAGTGLTPAMGAPVYFCDSHSPWERGHNENTNELLRDYCPSARQGVEDIPMVEPVDVVGPTTSERDLRDARAPRATGPRRELGRPAGRRDAGPDSRATALLRGGE